MTKHGKKYTAAAAKVDFDKVYSAREAIALAKETSITKFDSTVEVHMRTTLDSRQADQQLRDRVLGPRGLMPNPKAGTVVSAQDMERAIKEAKAGRVEFRLDKTNNIHVSIGKASFEVNKLIENYAALMDAVNKARPSGAKGNFVKRITVTTTMGPGMKMDPNEHMDGAE